MSKLAALALFLVALSGCAAQPAATAHRFGGEVVNKQCRCQDDALCVQQAGAPAAPIACIAARSGCASLSSPAEGRVCWGSPTISGLCLCSGNAKVAVAGR